MTTLLEQARKTNQEREYPYYIKPAGSRFVARHDYYRNEPFHRSYSWPTTVEKYNAMDSNFPTFDTIAEARTFIQDTLIEDQILQDERDAIKFKLARDFDIC